MRWPKPRTLLRCLLTAALALAGAALPLSAAPAADKINVGILPLVSHAPTVIAQAKGYFAKEGLAVGLVKFLAAEPMAVAIATGDVDFGVTAISAGLISLAQKGVVKVIGGALEEAPGIEGQKILVSKAAYDQGVTGLAQLKGRSFGITTAGSSFQYMAYKIAEKAGFPSSELHLKPLQKVPALIAALKTGQIDAWSIVPDIAASLTKSGDVVEIGKIADVIPHYQVTTVFTSTKNTEARPALVRRFLAAYGKGVADYNAALVDKTVPPVESAAIVAIVAKGIYPDLPPEQAAARIKGGAMRISPEAALNLESVEDQLNWLKAEGLVPADSSMRQLVDTRFAKSS